MKQIRATPSKVKRTSKKMLRVFLALFFVSVPKYGPLKVIRFFNMIISIVYCISIATLEEKQKSADLNQHVLAFCLMTNNSI